MTDGNYSRKDMADRLVLLRHWAGYKGQKDFAEANGLTAPELNHFESGRRQLPLNAANVLRKNWKVTLDWLYHGDRSGLTVTVDRSLPTLEEFRKSWHADE